MLDSPEKETVTYPVEILSQDREPLSESASLWNLDNLQFI